jgi:hypothetical protein
MGACRKDKAVSDEITVRGESRDPNVVAINPIVARESNVEARREGKLRQEPIAPLFSDDESRGLRTRWENLQVGFVDEPRGAVEQADQLVNETIRGLTSGFANEREKLEKQWHQGADASTEDLRLAFQRYRSFFERLLSI